MPDKKNQKQKLRFIPYKLRKFTSLTSIAGRDSESLAEDPDEGIDKSNQTLTNSNSTIDGGDLTTFEGSSCSILDQMNQSTQPTQGPATNQVEIFNSLRIPDAIKDLPKFDGNQKLLYEFLNNVEEILLYIRGTDNTPYGQILLRAIRNKIEGQANEVLNMYGTPLIWDDIKNNLILHYSDKRTETSLIRDLHNVRQYNKAIEPFYGEIIEIQSSLCNNILIHEKDPGVINAKKSLYSEMCLNSFLSGLNEPLGSRVRAMQPRSLAEALSCCVKEQNISYQRAPQTNRVGYHTQYRPYENRFQQNRNRNQNWQRNQDYGNTRHLPPVDKRPQSNQFDRNFTPQVHFNRNRNQYLPNSSRYQPYEPRHLNHDIPRIKASPSQQTRFNPNLNFHETTTSNNYRQLDKYLDNDPNNFVENQNLHRRQEFINNGHNNNEPTNIEDAGNFFRSASNSQLVT